MSATASFRRLLVGGLLALALSGAASAQVVISQMYGGGGNSGSLYKNDFIELFNRGSTAVDLNGWSVQYASATGSTWTVTPIGALVLQPGQYLLIQQAAGAGGTLDLPTPDVIGTIGMGGSSGKVLLIDAITAQSGTCPADVVDIVSASGSNCEGTAASGMNNSSSIVRAGGGCIDTNNNSADFSASNPPTPRNTASPLNVCPVPDLPPEVTSTVPVDGATDVALNSTISINFSEDVTLTGAWYTLECPATTPIASSYTGADPGSSFVITPDAALPPGTVCTVTVLAAQVSDVDGDADPMAGDFSFSFTTLSLDPQLNIDDVSLAEGDSGTTLFQFTVSLTNAASGAFTVDFATIDGSATLADNDYVISNGTLNFAGNDGETQTIDVMVNGDLTPEPDETFSVVLSNPSLPSVALADDIGLGTIVNDDGLSIPSLQGSGFCSPLVPGCTNSNNLTGPVVLTRNNVVTAVGSNIFAMQDPVGDGNLATSDGLLVFTGSAPSCIDGGMPRALQAGDLVDVQGPIVEFFGLTEIGTPNNVTCVGTSALPDPVVFALDEVNGDIPSRDPTALYCGVVGVQQNNFECLEGMLVQVTDGEITRGNVRRGTDTYAEVHFGPHGLRSLREPGVRFGNSLEAGNPAAGSWDGNPEMLEMNADRLDAALSGLELVGGARFASVGILGFDFSDYEFWPVPGSFNLELASNVLPRPVRASTAPSELTIASYNMFRFCDAVAGNTVVTCLDPEPSPADVTLKVQRLSDYIRTVLRSPDVVGAQEVENLAVLQLLAARLNSDDSSLAYQAFLEEGNDVGGIDVGFLINTNRVQVDAVTQLRADQTWLDPNSTPNPALLHDRPALLFEGRFLDAPNGPLAFAVMVNHFRSRGGVDTGNAAGNRTRAKRFLQALAVAEEIQAFQNNPANSRTPLIVVGDMNDYQFSDGYADIVGLIGGIYDDAANTCAPANGVTTCDLNGPNIVNPALLNLVEVLTEVEPNQNYSYLFSENFGNIQGQARDVPTGQVLDHILADSKIEPLTVDMAFGRANVDASQQGFAVGSGPDGAGGSQVSLAIGSSDHDGLVAYFDTDCSIQPHPGDGDGDGVCDLVDNCPLVANPGQADPNGDGIGAACNAAPVFVTQTLPNALEGSFYSQLITVTDADGNALSISNAGMPAWLSLSDNGDGTATISGTPAASDVGNGINLDLTASDGDTSTAQRYTIDVVGLPVADVSISLSGDTEVACEAPVSVTFSVQNAGPAVATDVVVAGSVPVNGGNWTVQAAGAVVCSQPDVNGDFSCSLASLAAAANATGLVTGTPSAFACGNSLAFGIEVSSNNSDPDTANNADAINVAILAAPNGIFADGFEND